MAGGYWIRESAPGAEIAIAYTGAVAPEAHEAWGQLIEDAPGAGLLAVTSADRLSAGWHAAERARQHGEGQSTRCHVERLLEPLASDAGIVTVTDGHPEALSWIGGVLGHRIKPLGVEHFGQSGNLPDLFAKYRIDADAILDACAAVLVGQRVVRPVSKAAE
jgi:pyruvate dehydrogenase E1 component